MPGLIATPKVRALPDGVGARLSGALPLGRLGAPEELAAAIAFLLTPGPPTSPARWSGWTAGMG
jgi:3-oxoacyl-[acyl-carrier protein] reductase